MREQTSNAILWLSTQYTMALIQRCLSKSKILRRLVKYGQGFDMGMQRSAVTAPTAAGDTTVTRTGWPQNHRALALSAE